jgi:long-subunit fatty acid transport protein
MKHYARLAAVATIAALIIGIPCMSHSQILAGLALEKLGILCNQGTGARPFAMGGAYTAVSDDAFALIYNPAGLAEMRRKEIAMGLHQRSDEITNTYLRLSGTQSSSHTSLGHLAAVYPYPTYRGSLVFAFGLFQAGTSYLESVKNAHLADIPATAENRYVQSGTIYQYHFGLGFDLSPRVALGASFVIWDESVDFTDRIDYADADSTALWNDNVKMDLDGVSFNMGLLVRLSENLRAGFSFTSPAWLTYRGDGITTYDGTYAGGGGWTTDPDYAIIEEDYTLPMKFNGGLALRFPLLTLAADVSYTDYAQTKYNGLAITSELDAGMEHVLEAAWSFRLGAEAMLPQAPVRFRAGFAYVPLELSTVEEIAYIADDSPRSIIADFEAGRERRFFTFGIGGLIDRVLTLDLGVAIGGYEKVTKDGTQTVLTEERSITELVLSGAYRF